VRAINIAIAMVGLLCLLGGCADSYPSNPEGKDAKSGKEYTKDDARSAQPQRKGSDSSDE